MISASDARALSERPGPILASIVQAAQDGYVSTVAYLYREENVQATVADLIELGYSVTIDDNKNDFFRIGAVRLLITW